VNIETTELIKKLRAEEALRHEQQLQIESDRHERELVLILGLEQTVQRWENEGVPADAEPPAEQPPIVRRKRGPNKPKVRAASIGTIAGNGHAPAVNCAAEFRDWIAKRGNESFVVDEIAADVSASTGLVLQTVKSRLFPFLMHLNETGQVTIEGDKRHRIYAATSAFKTTAKRGRGTSSEPASESTTGMSYSERKALLGLDKPTVGA
jgi:hypothetical protein